MKMSAVVFLPAVVLMALASLAQEVAAPPTLPLGTVKILGPATCPSNAAKGAVCKSMRVSCPGIPDLDGTLGVTKPTGTTQGSIVLISGSGGTAFYNSGFADAYVTDGFRVVQFSWNTDWESTGGIGLKTAACRPATVLQYVFNTVHQKSRTTGYCGQGLSAGGATMAFAMAHYGLADYLDYVVIGGGPGVSRLDYGCDRALYTGPKLNLCPQLTDAPYGFGNGDKVNGWENTTTCATRNPPQADIDKWASDSIISTGANYSYPKTSMSWYFCTTKPNNSTGQGKFLIDQVLPRNVPDVNCYSGICQNEAVWQDPAAADATKAEMLSMCVPNHTAR